MQRLRVVLLTGLLCALFGSAAEAYTVVFRDGSSVVALEPMTVQGELVLVTLPSGTQTTFPLADVDVKRTEELNELGVRSGLILDRNDLKVLTPLDDDGSSTTDPEAFRDFVRSNPGMDLMADRDDQGRDLRRTPAGNVDLFRIERRVIADRRLAKSLGASFRRREQRQFRLFAGTQPDSILVDFMAGTEAEVFGALSAAAEVLLESLRENGEPQRLEVVMASSNRSRAGQFLITPQSARTLLDESTDVADFFLRNVQF